MLGHHGMGESDPSAQAVVADPSEVIAEQEKRDQARRQRNANGERLDHPRALSTIVIEIVECSAQADHDEHQSDDDDNAYQGGPAEEE
jgi:hypothetical protein